MFFLKSEICQVSGSVALRDVIVGVNSKNDAEGSKNIILGWEERNEALEEIDIVSFEFDSWSIW